MLTKNTRANIDHPRADSDSNDWSAIFTSCNKHGPCASIDGRGDAVDTKLPNRETDHIRQIDRYTTMIMW